MKEAVHAGCFGVRKQQLLPRFLSPDGDCVLCTFAVYRVNFTQNAIKLAIKRATIKCD